MDKKLSTMEFVRLFSEYSRISQKDVSYFLNCFGDFLGEAIESGTEIQLSGLFTLYYSTMKSRDTVKVGSNEKTTLPPTRKARLRLAYKHRMNQKTQNRLFRPFLEENEALTNGE